MCTYTEHSQRIVERCVAALDVPQNLISFQVALEEGPVNLLLQQLLHLRVGSAKGRKFAIQSLKQKTHVTSAMIGFRSSCATESPASNISSRMDNKISAQRSVRRRHAMRFICNIGVRLPLAIRRGKLTSTCCKVSQITNSVLAATSRPGTGTKLRESALSKSSS